MSQTRRLAAILASDVAGYLRLIGTDEGGTLHEVAPFQWTVCQLAVYVLVMAACMSAS